MPVTKTVCDLQRMVEGSGASITVKVIKAESVRQHLGKKPDVAVHLRVNVGQCPALHP